MSLVRKCSGCRGPLIRQLTKIEFTGVALTKRGIEPQGIVKRSKYICPKCDPAEKVTRCG